MSWIGYFLIALVLAVLLDLALILRAQADLRRWGISRAQAEHAVFVFGFYSPLLTWLKQRLQGVSQSFRRIRKTAKSSPEAAPDEAQPVQTPGWRQAWPEWLFILIAVSLFCAGFLDLNARTRLLGNEAEIFQSLDWTLVNSLGKYGQFPMWNPNLETGQPYIADPMLHAYNPVVTLPALLFGVRAGFKLAVFFSFLLAAFGMWRLGVELGLGRWARVWMALMYTFAGQPVARFIQGQYLFIFGFAWLPWILFSLLLVTRTRRRLHLAQTVFFLALLFFSGNVYYQFYMLVAAGLFVLAMTVQRSPRSPFVGLNGGRLKTYLLIGMLSLGLIALQLLPLIEIWPRLNKDMNLEGSHTLMQIFLDYTSRDANRPDAWSVLPASEEFYAYIGLGPFLALLFLPVVFYRQRKHVEMLRVWSFFLLLLFFVVLWVNTEGMPWGGYFERTRMLLQFRHLLRILLFGSLALIILAAASLDALWRSLRGFVAAAQDRLPRLLGNAGLLLLGGCMALGLIDVYSSNRGIVRTFELDELAYETVGWLQEHDTADYYVRVNPNNTWAEAVISADMRFIDVWYHFNDLRSIEGIMNRRPVQAQPHYILQLARDARLGIPGQKQVAAIHDAVILQANTSLPMAFSVPDATLAQEGDVGPVRVDEVTPLTPFFPGPNDVEVIASGDSDQTLVVLVTHYPGWRLYVDGRSQPLANVSGYLAADMQPGSHRYVFSFRPTWFFVGVWISLFALGICLYLVYVDVDWRALALRLRRARKMLKGWWSGLEIGRRLGELRPAASAPAVFRQGALLPQQPLELPEETQVSIVVESAEGKSPLAPAIRRWLGATTNLVGVLGTVISPEAAVFGAALLLYLATRLIGITQFPIYFFTDEAIQTLLASDLLRNGLLSPENEFLPTFLRNVDHYNLSTSVYLQMIPTLLLGKSVLVTRTVAVLATLMAAVSVGLILRNIFRLPYWWSATLLLSATPTWFLHSRTAFETTLMVSFYAAALYFYLLYRYREASNLYKALILFALAFYSYSPGQVVVVATGLLLLLSDARYHWQNRAVGLRGAGLLILLALPYLRFRMTHALAFEEHLLNLNSYWIQPISLNEKLGHLVSEYTYGLSPAYWFFPNGRDLVRHLMSGYGHLLTASLPLVALGLLVCLKEWRSPAHRLVLAALLAAPSGAAMAQIAVTRALVMVIPAALLAALGLIAGLQMIQGAARWLHLRLADGLVGLVVFGVLAVVNVNMLNDALANGPTWYQDYVLGGMQYGAAQVYSAAQAYADSHPDQRVIVTPVWANGPDILARFFLPAGSPVELGSIDAYTQRYQPIDASTVFVMTPGEYEMVQTSGKFTDIKIKEILPYPNGQPGFYFVQLRYVENIQAILEAERQARRQLQQGEVIIAGQAVQARYPALDMGQIAEMFDGNKNTLVRTLEANPFVVELTFSEPHSMGGGSLFIGDTEVKVKLQLYTDAGQPPIEFEFRLDGSVQTPQVSFELPQRYAVTFVHMEITDLRQGDPGNVHIWDFQFR